MEKAQENNQQEAEKNVVADVASSNMQQLQAQTQKVMPASPTRLRRFNDVINAAKLMPDLKPLFGTLWQKGEITVLAGDTGVGKSILAVNIADAIASGKPLSDLVPATQQYRKMLYYDFELSDKQFEKRFRKAIFEDILIRVDIDPDCLDVEFSFDSISSDVEKTGAEIIIIDNISALSLKTTIDQEAAVNIMKQLKRLQTERALSILVLAHTPKIPTFIPLSLNHVSGSKAITNFVDSVFFVARSTQGNNIRYLKQVKSRNEEMMEDVLACRIINKDGFLTFEVIGADDELNHLTSVQNNDQKKEIAARLHNEGKTMEEIGQELGINKSTVSRWLKPDE